MAKKTMTRKITRRDAVALLGAGTMVGVVRAPASSGGQPDNHPSCNTAATVETYSSNTREAIVSYSCCQETKHAILVGVEEPTLKATPQGKVHLRPLQDRLNSDNLLEYCFMIWGLDADQLKELSKIVPGQLGLKAVKRPVKK